MPKPFKGLGLASSVVAERFEKRGGTLSKESSLICNLVMYIYMVCAIIAVMIQPLSKSPRAAMLMGWS